MSADVRVMFHPRAAYSHLGGAPDHGFLALFSRASGVLGLAGLLIFGFAPGRAARVRA